MWMRKAFRIERWNHTSQILAMLFNANPPDSGPAYPWEFHPYDPRHYQPPVKGHVTDLISMIPKEKRSEARRQAKENAAKKREGV